MILFVCLLRREENTANKSRSRCLNLRCTLKYRTLKFYLDARTKFDPPLPEGFYGNAISFACAKTTAGELSRQTARLPAAQSEGENNSSEEDSSFWGVRKQFWKERFSYLNKYKQIPGRDKPLPKWTDADVEEFIQSDPVYGPQVVSHSSISLRGF